MHVLLVDEVVTTFDVLMYPFLAEKKQFLPQKLFHDCSLCYVLLLSTYSSVHLTIYFEKLLFCNFYSYPVRIRNTDEDYTYQQFSSSESTVDICRY